VVRVTANDRTVPHPLPGTAAANELTLTPSPAARQMRFDFDVRGPRPVYGVSFESPGGVTLDNFSFRGNSGMSLTRIPYKELAAFGKLQAYDLIILHYGVNVASSRVRSFGWYERAMTRVVDRMQRAFPQASILIVGMSDKSARIDGEFQTDPSVPRLLAAQRRLAERNHAAFWNLFEAMGGENSMVSWVEESPALANKDYTHVNFRGARKIAGLLFDYLMSEYAHPGAPGSAPAGPAAAPAATDSPATKPALPTDSAAAVMR
jgi:lysophospholipase L1-like esterase